MRQSLFVGGRQEHKIYKNLTQFWDTLSAMIENVGRGIPAVAVVSVSVPEEEEPGRRLPLKIKSVNLETVCGVTSRLPENQLVEIAFAGRSNVGKSSLINALINRKSYARTSQQPGKTQTINFYRINDALYFVDLPGYGYARVSKSTARQWGKMIDGYLENSRVLRLVFLLVDIRHRPSQNDIQMYDWCIQYGFQPIIIATKEDKVKRSQKQKLLREIQEALQVVEGTPVIPFSSVTKAGREEIWEYIDMVHDSFLEEQR